ncbi:MAG: hypothetical protein HC838_06270 [Spirulinaceae cyanobacterium RM2_2_10]|nr:hypothetical protein [Spirulinaceae cyanobacterium RM2_2_10]
MVSSVSSEQTLGDRYRILKILGQDRFGVTYLVEELQSGGEQRLIAEF